MKIYHVNVHDTNYFFTNKADAQALFTKLSQEERKAFPDEDTQVFLSEIHVNESYAQIDSEYEHLVNHNHFRVSED